MGFRLPKSKGMLRRDAANWLARLQSAEDPDIQRKFQRWHDADPRHSGAFERVKRSYERAGLLRQSALARLDPSQAALPKPQRTAMPALAAAVAAVVLVPVGVVLVRGGAFPLGGTEAVMLMTNVGEIKQVSLADGSKVTLDTSTKVEVEIGRSRRTAHLLQGRARFEVVSADVPFIVGTEGTSISTHGGTVDVQRIAEQDQVEVLAGTAEVRGTGADKAAPVAVGAGEALTVDSAGAGQRAVAAPGPDWTQGMLQFDDTPLPEAVTIANRYSRRQILLAGDLSALRVTGAFRAGDTIGLAKALAAAFSLSLEQRPDGALMLSRTAPASRFNKKGG